VENNITITVLGAGSMGTGIAQVAATAGHKVVLYDTNPEALKKAQAFILKMLNRSAEKGRISDADAKAIFGRLYLAEDLTAAKDSDLVIEAIIENLEIKQSVFKKLENIVNKKCILASNTSSLSIASIAAACTHPERVVGIHFFNPAPLMKLVEIIPAIQTDDTVLTTARTWIDEMGKLTVLAKDTPGFIVNRVARPFYGEALRIYEEGIAEPATIDWAMTEIGGFRMGPFTLMDYIGNDINYTVTATVFKAFYYDPRYRPSFVQQRLSEAGYLGRKSGKGYYEYGENSVRPEPKRDAVLGKQVFSRILVMLINEAADALHLRIANREDIDLAMTKGVNYPKGLLAWADEIGIDNCVKQIDALYDEYHEDRYRCSPLLRRMQRKEETFFEHIV